MSRSSCFTSVCVPIYTVLTRHQARGSNEGIYPDVSKRKDVWHHINKAYEQRVHVLLFRWILQHHVGPALDSSSKEKNYSVLSLWFKEAQPVFIHTWTCLRCSLAGYAAQCCGRASQDARAEFIWPCFLSTGTHGGRSMGAGSPPSPAHLRNGERW